MDSDDVLSAAATTSDEERRLRLIIEATPNAMVMVDVEGRIVLVNSQTEVLFGYRRSQLLEMTVEQLIPARFRPGHQDYRRGFFAHPDTRSMGAGRDLFGLRSDGTEVPIEIGLNPLQTDEGMFVLASIIDITERKRSEERLLQVVEAAPNAMIMVNEQGRISLVNTEAERSFGYRRDELLTMQVEDLLPQRFRSQHLRFRAGFFDDPDRRAMGVGRVLYGLRKDGTEMPIEIGLNPIQVMDEQFVLASVIDITARISAQAEEDAARQHELRRSIFDSLPFSIIATDPEGGIVTANPAAAALLGYGQDELVGSPLSQVDGDERARSAEWVRTFAAAAGNEREWVYRRKDGTRVPVNEAIAPMHSDAGEISGYLAVAYDITKRIEAQARVHHMANHDSLTNLPNRTRLVNHLVGALNRADRDGTEVALLLLDLDHFKRVNDSLGHHVGDELLLRVADRLKTWIRGEDLVARLGGDEFVVVFAGLQPGSDLSDRVERLLSDVLIPVVLNGHELVVTVSIGGATYPRDAGNAATLLKNADIAMYHAKSSGRNNFQWFQDRMLDETNDKISLSSALRQALGQGELSVEYQTQVDLRTGHVVGLEALARWRSPLHGPVPPDRFIPVAEDGGMIVQLGGWVLRRACADVAAIQAELAIPLRLAVNVSPRQFRSKEWLAEIVDALEETGLDPSVLELEITEGILMDDHDDVIEVLHSIRELGINIVVDDFGRGYSSLAYLTRFPVDKLKIDRSFVQKLTTADADAAIVDAIIAMAHALGISVVAEGVETAEQESYLRERGCDEAQGYHYSRGLSAADVVHVARSIGVGVDPRMSPHAP